MWTREQVVITKPMVIEAGSDALGSVQPFRKAALVVNTRSRRGERVFDLASHLLPQLGVPVEVTCALGEPHRLHEVVTEALEEGCDLIVLGGGDGSVSSAVDPLAHHHAALGVLPVGTANDFARTLGIPFEIEKACETVASGVLVDVDLGLAGQNYYVNVASVGLSTEVARRLSHELKRRLGALAYPAAAAKALARRKPFAAQLVFPDGDYSPVTLPLTLQVSVGNGRFYGGGFVVAPGAGIDDRMLDVYAIEAGPYRELLRVLRLIQSGEHVQSDLVHHFRTAHIRVDTQPTLPINIDGEISDHTPATFSLAPNALRVLTPRSSGAARLDLKPETTPAPTVL